MASQGLEHFEQEAEAARASLEARLDELEARLSPDRLMEEAAGTVAIAADDGQPRRLVVDKWSLGVVALAAAWLLMSGRHDGGAAATTVEGPDDSDRRAIPAQ